MHDEPRAKIHVYCPPLLQYIQFALALAPPDEVFRTSEFNVVIHPGDRLLDRAIYSAEEGHEACRSYMLFSVLMQDWGSQMTVSVRAWSASATSPLALTKFGWTNEQRPWLRIIIYMIRLTRPNSSGIQRVTAKLP